MAEEDEVRKDEVLDEIVNTANKGDGAHFRVIAFGHYGGAQKSDGGPISGAGPIIFIPKDPEKQDIDAVRGAIQKAENRAMRHAVNAGGVYDATAVSDFFEVEYF